MKKALTAFILLSIAITPLFRGLFYYFETSLFFTIITILFFLYFIVKLIKKEDLAFSKLLLFLIIALIAAVGLSFINAVNIRGNIKALQQYTLYFMITIVLFDYFHDKKKQFSLAVTIPVVITGFISAVIGLEALTGSFAILKNTVIKGRIGSTFEYPNTAAIFFAICIIFSLTIINTTDKIIARILLSGAGNIIFLAFFLTASRGGCIIGVCSIFLFIILQPSGHRLKSIGYFVCITSPLLLTIRGFSDSISGNDVFLSSKWLVISFVLASFAGLLLSFILKTRYKKINPLANKIAIAVIFISAILLIVFFRDKIIGVLPENALKHLVSLNFDESVRNRLDLDRYALRLIKENWVFGYGGGGFTALYQSVEDTYLVVKDVHNNFFQVFVETGILGFLSYMAIVITAAVKLIIVLIKTTDTKLKMTIAGFLCAFSGLALHSAMDFDLSFQSLGMLFWVLIAAFPIFHPASKRIAGSCKNIGKIIFTILGVILLSYCSVSLVSSYHAYKGDKYMTDQNFEASIAHYQEANKWDPNNSEYTYQLAKLCNYFGNSSSDSLVVEKWKDMAIKFAKKSAADNPYDPFKMEILTRTYFDADMPIEGCENAEKQVKSQRCSVTAFDLLAKGYIEASIQYLKDQDIEKAKEMLMKCAKLESTQYVELSMDSLFYKAEAMLLLENYKDAVTILLKTKKSEDSDTLLYIAYEMTDMEAEIQEKYSPEEINTIQNSMLYTIASGIIDSKILQ